MEFQKETFEKMASMMKPIYLNDSHKDKSTLKGSRIDARISSSTVDSIMTKIRMDDLQNRLFFKFDNKTWTIADFIELYASHPLVFRKKRIKEDEYLEQFKFAVADLLRDYVINQKAYKQGIDKVPVVVEQTNMWRDAILASYYQFNYLRVMGVENNFKKDYLKTIDQYLNAHVGSLFQKYSNRIQINVQAFEKIKLTRIDLIALNKNVPYQETVPAFPLVTTKTNLNYGKKLE